MFLAEKLVTYVVVTDDSCAGIFSPSWPPGIHRYRGGGGGGGGGRGNC